MYYVIACPSPDEGYNVRFHYEPDDPFRSWSLGTRFDDEPPAPVEVSAKVASDSVFPEFSDITIPLMTTKLHEALLSAGVDNLNVYPALVSEEKGGKKHTQYVAFNLIGAISAANLKKSEYQAPNGLLFSVDFASISVDETKSKGALMFRLAESTNVILVHESVKQHLEAAGFTGLKFYDPKNYVS